jgi:hypothetical protein
MAGMKIKGHYQHLTSEVGCVDKARAIVTDIVHSDSVTKGLCEYLSPVSNQCIKFVNLLNGNACHVNLFTKTDLFPSFFFSFLRMG